MNYKSVKNPLAWGALTLLVLAQSLVAFTPARAETTARLDGRCKLSNDKSTLYDGHCIVKQKQRGDTVVVVVKMDSGNEYRFYGPSTQALQMETYSGIHNVQYKEKDSKEVFTWDEYGQSQKLAVILDAQRQTNVSHDDPQQDLGTLIGAGVGALIGSLLSGGNAPQSPANTTTAQGSQNPYAGKDYYNATAYFRCSVGNDSHNQSCPGGIRRQGNGQASITVLFPNGNEVQYDFKGGNVTSTFGGDLTWGKSGDEWYIGIDRKLFIIIPDAAVYGG